MKGDVYRLGDVVRVTGMDGFAYNGKVGRVNGIIQAEGKDCPPYRIDVGDGINIITCACYLTSEVPAIPRDWDQTVTWQDCQWRPHLGNLKTETFKSIIRQIEAARRRRGEIQ